MGAASLALCLILLRTHPGFTDKKTELRGTLSHFATPHVPSVAREHLTKSSSRVFCLPAAVPKQINPENLRPRGLGAINSGFGSFISGAHIVMHRLYGGSPCRRDPVLQSSKQLFRTARDDLSQSRWELEARGPTRSS